MNRLLCTALIATVLLTTLAQSARADFFEKVTGMKRPSSVQHNDPKERSLDWVKVEQEDLWSFTKAHITREGRAYGDRKKLGQSSYLGKARKVWRGNVVYWEYYGKGYHLSRYYGLSRRTLPGTGSEGSAERKTKLVDFQKYSQGLKASNLELQRLQQLVDDGKAATESQKDSKADSQTTQKEE